MAMTTMTRTAEFVDSTPLLQEPSQLRERANEDGCLFLEDCLTRIACSRSGARFLRCVERTDGLQTKCLLSRASVNPGFFSSNRRRTSGGRRIIGTFSGFAIFMPSPMPRQSSRRSRIFWASRSFPTAETFAGPYSPTPRATAHRPTRISGTSAGRRTPGPYGLRWAIVRRSSAA